jgi:PAS domain S-box-containing protein
MTPVTGLMFGMAGTALILFSGKPTILCKPGRVGWIGLLVGAMSLASLADRILGARQAATAAFDRAAAIEDRPSILTALAFGLTGVALGLLNSKRGKFNWLSEIAIIAAMGISVLALVGYAFDVKAFYRWPSIEPQTGMSFFAAAGFVALGIGLLCARPDRILITVVTGSTTGGTVARFLLLAPVAVPVISAFLQSLLRRSGYYNAEFSNWSFSFFNILAFSAVIGWVATLLHRADTVRRLAEGQVRELNAHLEDRVAERTDEWARANRRLEEQIEQRQRAEKNLREHEASFRLMFFNNPLPIWVYNAATGQILEVNQTAAEHYGYSREEFLRMRISELEATGACAPRASENGIGYCSCKHRAKDGRIRDVETVSHPIELAGQSAVLLVANDITERLALEAQLRQAQKLESIGQLAGGIAHDFNNILTAILGHASMLLTQKQLNAADADAVGEISIAAERAAGLTRQLLTFSRKQVLQTTDLDLNAVVSQIMKMLGRVLGEDVLLQAHYSRTPALLRADQGMLEQVILNLAVNSRDAMPKGGELTISVNATECGEGGLPGAPEAAPGRYICLTVADTGSGIPSDILPKIFEPFFTTKDVGKGTGLGLATVYGIVKLHKGWIVVNSQIGKGAEFHVYLPALTDVTADIRMPITSTRLRRGVETVLYVEDEPSVRLLVGAILRRNGYTVVEAESGPAAKAAWGRSKDSINLLLTDMIMPGGLAGHHLAKEFQSDRPNLRVVYTSGYSFDAIQDQSSLESVHFLPKPFTPEHLLDVLRSCLDSPQPRPVTNTARPP